MAIYKGGQALPQVTPKTTKRRGILSHPQDIHCVLYHLLALVAYNLSRAK